jgi:Sulfotransferase domain
MKVIGAGLPRTATLTQKVALEMLGFGPCYHMVNVLGDLDLVPVWRAALDGDADWHKIFEGFESSVDWPGSYYYKELMEIWPDAKVLLSERDPASWERSMQATIVDVLEADSLTCHLSKAAGLINPKWQAYSEMMIEMWKRFGVLDESGTWGHFQEEFNRHNEEVKQTVPSDNLLTWQAADGWEPLCEFLKVDVPGQPLPHTNDAQVFASRVNDMSVSTINAWHEQVQAESAQNGAGQGAGSQQPANQGAA